MARTIGIPVPDCVPRRERTRMRRDAITALLDRRGSGVTMPNGEEVDYGMGFAASYHKGLPHDVNGVVDAASYHAMVRILVGNETGAVETLPMGGNRRGAGVATDPIRYTLPAADKNGNTLGYRKLTSPFTGHVHDPIGADAAAFAISEAPRLNSDELAAEMAEVYAMALLRDVPFTAIDDESGANVAAVRQALDSMPFFQANFNASSDAERRRYETRGVITSGHDLFRGSTPGAKAGPWLTQFLLAGSSTDGGTFLRANGTAGQGNTSEPSFRGTFARFDHNEGFVLYGTQIVDQRSIVAREDIDFMTNWASWLDCQNGVDFNNFNIFRDRRRYITTPRDIATYVHFDALYQAYQVACLLMLGEGGGRFPKDRGMPETSSRTRSAFVSFGGPHILSLVTEVATRALKAVWRQKWMHHRRARPEVVAAWLTLHENNPALIGDNVLRDAIAGLRSKLPQSLLDMVSAHNTAQTAAAVAHSPTNGNPPRIVPDAAVAGALPTIADDKNFLLPMAFPEGSPTHPAYGAGHATVAGACVTVLKAFFEMFDADGRTELAWPLTPFVPTFSDGAGGNANEGGELVDAVVDPAERLTIQGELDKLAANISIARDMAGVHYYTDYYESLRLGERIAVSIIEEHLSMYSESVSMSFTSFDGDHVRISSNGDTASVRVSNGTGPIGADHWYARYEY